MPKLSAVRQEAVVAPPSVEFGDTTIGSTLSGEIVVSPAGTTAQNDRIDAIDAPCAEFAVDTARLPIPVTRVCGQIGTDVEPAAVAGDDVEDNAVQVPCTTTVAKIPATFTPRVVGTATCNVTLRGTFGTLSVLLRGTGVLPQLAISVTPVDVAFGDVRINTTSAPATIAIRNIGSQPIQIGSVSVMQPAGVFTLGGANGNHVLPPGATENHPLTCRPPTTNAFTASVRVASNAENAPVVAIPVSCQGTDSEIEMLASPIELITRVRTPRDQVIAITNTGTAPSEIKEINLVNTKGLDELTFVAKLGLPVTLPPGGSVTPPIQIRFAASTEIPFGELGRLRVVADDRTTELVINGAAQLATVGLNPDGISLGPVCIGSTEAAQLAVFASAEGELALTSIDEPAAPFAFRPVDPPTLPATAMGGHANDLMLEASVTPTVPGPLTATAVLNVDIRSNPTRVVTLTAEGIEAGVSAFPRALDFGTIDVPAIAQGQTVGLTNCNDTAIEVLGAEITGPSKGEFGIVAPPVIAGVLDRKERLDLLVVMSPRTGGPKTAQLVIRFQDGVQIVELVGNGNGPIDTRDTYYRCSAGGGPGGLLPAAGVLVGLLGVRRRRRR